MKGEWGIHLKSYIPVFVTVTDMISVRDTAMRYNCSQSESDGGIIQYVRLG